MKWKTAKIGDVCQIVSGTTPSTSIAEYWGGEFNWIAPAEIEENSKFIFNTQKTITQRAVSETSMRLLPVGTVLLSSRAPIGKVAIAATEMYCNQGFKNLICSDEIHNGFLFWFLKGKKDFLNSLGRGATFKEISKSIVASVEIPLPPLAEQRRIAAILDKADAIRRKRQQSLELADNLLKSVFWGMFGDPVTNPKGWGKFRVGTVLEIIEAGWSANGVARLKQHGELAVLKVSAVTYGVFNEDEYKVIENGTSIKKYVYPQKGDLLFSRANTRELVGATCLIFNDYPELLLPDKLWKLHFNEKTNNCYMKFALSSADARGQLTEESTGTSGSMYNISMEKLKNISVSLPPIALQNKFAAIAESMEASKCILRQANNEADHAFKSLQQSFFG